MKITPYLLALNGFTQVTGVGIEFWRRVEVGHNGLKHLIIDIKQGNGHEDGYQNVEYDVPGVWHVDVYGPGVFVALQVKQFQDLMALSEIIARNQHGFTDVPPIEIGVPDIYTANDWERGDYDQYLWDDHSYSYTLDNIGKYAEVMVPDTSYGYITLKPMKPAKTC